jgi:DNA-binding beta-propeller fold protein YncE
MMDTQVRFVSRLIRRAAVLILLIGMITVFVQVSTAQTDAPRASSAGTLTMGVTTTPAGGADFWLTAASFQNYLGGLGAGWYTFQQPRDIEVDAAGNFYIADHRNNRVHKYNSVFKYVTRIAGGGKLDGQILKPNQIVIDNSRILIADTNNHRVSVFTLDGAFIRKFGGNGTGNGQFAFPMGVAVSSAGEIFVADTWNHRIQVFNADGVYVRQWGALGSGVGQFRFPAHIAFDNANNLYIADSNNHRIVVYDTQGNFLRQIGVPGRAAGQLWLPVGIDIGDDGIVYVADTYNYRVQKFMTDGTFVGGWGQVQGGPIISRPNGLLAVGNMVYVTDLDASRIQMFSQASVQVDHGQQLPATLPLGVYDVTQAPKTGWTFTGATCTGGSPVTLTNGVSVTLADGAAITCTFANSQ